MKFTSATLFITFICCNCAAFSQDLLETINSAEVVSTLTFISEDMVCFARSEQLMITRKLNTGWSKPIVAPFSGEFADEQPSFDAVSSRLFFSSKRPRPGQNTTLKSNDLWYTEYKRGKWSNPVHMGGIFSTDGIDSGGFGVGNKIYFHSDREGSGLNSVDIYMSDLDGSSLKKLNISSNKVDGEVFIFGNGDAMLFMSAGHGAIGESDIFFSVQKNGQWKTPAPIDTEGKVNTADWDYAPSISPDGETLYFKSSVSGQTNILSIELSSLSSYSVLRKFLE
jgi:hypothetical protein